MQMGWDSSPGTSVCTLQLLLLQGRILQGHVTGSHDHDHMYIVVCVSHQPYTCTGKEYTQCGQQWDYGNVSWGLAVLPPPLPSDYCSHIPN